MEDVKFTKHIGGGGKL